MTSYARCLKIIRCRLVKVLFTLQFSCYANDKHMNQEKDREGGRANSSRVGDTAEDNEELRTDVESADVNRC